MPESAASNSLAGLAVMVTRPAHQAEALCQLIETHGGTALRLPLLTTTAVADTESAAARLHACRDWDRWIFSSTNAVRYAAELVARPWPPLAAVGSVTAEALRAQCKADVLLPEHGDGAVALLAHPEFAAVAGQRLLLIAGEDPLPELEAGLHARGAEVAHIAVYRRQPVAHLPAEVAHALHRADVVVVSSAEALIQLLRLTPPDALARLLDLQLAVPSPRVVDKARELGFERTPLLPRRVTDADYLDAMQQYRRAGE